MKNFFSRMGQNWKGSQLYKSLSRFCQNADRTEDRALVLLYRWRFAIFIIAVTALAIGVRVSLWPIVSADYNECLHVWLDEIRLGSGFHTIGKQIGNYTAPYHYLMAAMTYIPGLTNLAVIKITSSLADFCMAAAAAAVCWQLTAVKWKTCACYALVLSLPTVFLNSAAWGQCDAMFTTFVLVFMALYLAQRPASALFFYGIALAIKLQAVFVFPAVIIFWLCGKIRLRHLLAGALGYGVMFLPAILGAGSFSPLFRAYAMQTKVQALASNIYNFPALFIGVDETFLGYLSPALIATAMVLLGVLALYCWTNKTRMTQQSDFVLVALLAILVPFLLPAMKDRYYYIIEVLAVVYALAIPRRIVAPLLMQLASLPCYMAYLTGAQIPFGAWPVLFVVGVVLLLMWDMRLIAAPNQKQASDSRVIKFG